MITGLIASGLAGCASAPHATDAAAAAEFQATNDPLEPTNRVFYAINDGLDTYVLRPVAVAYTYIPYVVRRPIHNFLDNLTAPVTFTNDVLETKPRRAGDTFMRFLINTTAGGLGAFDVASDWGYPAHGSDFGETLALWGLPEGPFLFLPVLGPSNPRDATGFAVDIAFDPFTYVPHGYGLITFNWARTGLSAIDARAGVLDDVDKVKRDALDPYATFRSLYRQHRASEIEAARSDDRATVPDWFK